MSDSPLGEILGFGLGKALFGGSTASEREKDRQQKERHQKELLEAIRKQSRQTIVSGNGVISCSNCGGSVSFTRKLRGTTQPCPHCNKNLYLWESAVTPRRIPRPEVVKMTIKCRKCNGLVEFTSDIKDTFAPCPHCKNDLLLKPSVSTYRHKRFVEQQAASHQPISQTKNSRSGRKPKTRKNSDLKVSCPYCNGHIAFSLAEFGGKVIECPHCSQLLQLPSS